MAKISFTNGVRINNENTLYGIDANNRLASGVISYTATEDCYCAFYSGNYRGVYSDRTIFAIDNIELQSSAMASQYSEVVFLKKGQTAQAKRYGSGDGSLKVYGLK